MSNSSKYIKKHKLDANDNTDVQDFVQNGYVIYENVHDTKMIKGVLNFVMDRYNILLKLIQTTYQYLYILLKQIIMKIN